MWHNMGNNCPSCWRNRRPPRRPSIRRPGTIEKPLRPPTVDPTLPIVQRIDLLIYENSREHKTDSYEATKRYANPCLVVRRGQSFRIRLIFQKDFNRNDYLLNLIFRVKDALKPNYAQNSEVVIPVNDENMNSFALNEIASMRNSWTAELNGIRNNILTIQVTPSANAIVAPWSFRVEVKAKRARWISSVNSFDALNPIYILFNPWIKADQTYMYNEGKRNEYVLNDNGLIWRGTAQQMRPTPWIYGQFEENVLECCMYILGSVGRLPIAERSNPVRVLRHLAAVVNDNDEGGVLKGSWEGSFDEGTKPTQWTGSPAILQEYIRTKKRVKYAQCWVFAGVLTTACRCLGIPSRAVTNFYSAHDTHNSLTVDRFFDDDLELIEEESQDSIWNFHVWTEVWLTRPDLAMTGIYDGWQVIDATPQEPSDGIYRTGPTSVEAVKRGEVLKPYDTQFVFAEVNADEVFWLKKDENHYKLLDSKTSTIGQYISTKSVGDSKREDITTHYKEKENSFKEREVMLKALRLSTHMFSRYYLNEKFEDVKFDLVLIDDILIGQAFSVRLKIVNRSGKVYSVDTVLAVKTTLYTGQTHSTVKKIKDTAKISPYAADEILTTVTYEEYQKHLVDQNSFIISAMATVLETDFSYFQSDDFRVRMPEIKIDVLNDIIEGRPFSCAAYFENPLPKNLTRGVFVVEGPGLGKPLRKYVDYIVRPHMEARITFTLTPKSAGEKRILVKFSSNELDDVDGYKNIRVVANPNAHTFL